MANMPLCLAMSCDPDSVIEAFNFPRGVMAKEFSSEDEIIRGEGRQLAELPRGDAAPTPFEGHETWSGGRRGRTIAENILFPFRYMKRDKANDDVGRLK